MSLNIFFNFCPTSNNSDCLQEGRHDAEGGGSITSNRQSDIYMHLYIHPAIKSNVAFPTCVTLVIPIFLVQNPSVCECACACVCVCVSVRDAHTINNATNMKNPAPKTLLPAGITTRNRYFCTSKASTFVLVKQVLLC
jgi:hypothetical protein